jgi:hypothetical protein
LATASSSDFLNKGEQEGKEEKRREKERVNEKE